MQQNSYASAVVAIDKATVANVDRGLAAGASTEGFAGASWAIDQSAAGAFA